MTLPQETNFTLFNERQEKGTEFQLPSTNKLIKCDWQTVQKHYGAADAVGTVTVSQHVVLPAHDHAPARPCHLLML